MKWLFTMLGTSIGKKLMMAATGICFCGFLAIHLIGNLTLYGGADFFNAYVSRLHSLGRMITVSEIVLLILAVVHVIMGLYLFLENLKARPVRYAMKTNAGGRTIGSMTMPYTGLVLLAFIIFHLIDFRFTDHTNRTVFQIVTGSLTNPGLVFLYIFGVLVAAIHVSHGFWSAFQTVGIDHPKYTPLIKGLSLIFSLAVALGFGLIPIYLSASV